MMILTVAAIWTAVLATAIAGVFLVRKIGEIEARKLDTEAFEEYLIYSRRKGNEDVQKFDKMNAEYIRQQQEVEELKKIFDAKERKLP